MFFGSFWQTFQYIGQVSALDRLLEQKDVKLEQILDEESFAQEVRNNSKKLSDHLIKNPSQLIELIDYIITEPTQDMDEKKKFKYPFLTSELFHAQPTELINYILSIKEDCSSSQANDEDRENQPANDDDQDKDNITSNDKEKDKDNNQYIQENITKGEDDNEEDEEVKQKPEETKNSDDGSDQTNPPQEEVKTDEDQDQAVQTQKNNFVESQSSEKKNDEEAEGSEKVEQEELKVENIDEPEAPSKVVQVQQPQVQITSKEVLQRIFSFFNVEDGRQLNSTNCGYYQKLFQMLISKSGHLWEQFKQIGNQVLKNMCKHLYSRSIAEIVLKLLTLEGIQKSNEEADENTDFYSEQRSELLGFVLDAYKNCVDEDEVLDNISYIVIDILQNAVNNSEKDQNSYLTVLVNKLTSVETRNIILEKLENSSKQNFYSVYFSLSILNQLIIYQTTDKKNLSKEDDGDTVTQDDSDLEHYSASLPTLIAIFDNRTLHIQPSNDGEEKFGLVRLKLVELLHNLIKVNDHKINQTLIEKKVLKILLDDFTKFHNHNVFHNFLDHIIETILVKNDSKEMKEDLLRTNLFQSFFKEIETIQNDESVKQTQENTKSSQTLFSNQNALRLNKLTIKNTQSGFYYKFLNIYFEKKSTLGEILKDNTELVEQLSQIENTFYKNLHELNKYILGGEEQQDGGDQPDIDIDLHHISGQPWSQYNQNHLSHRLSDICGFPTNKDDDDDDNDDDQNQKDNYHNKEIPKEEIENDQVDLFNHISSELSSGTREKSNSITKMDIEREAEEIQQKIEETLKKDQSYTSSSFWKQELSYELSELLGDISEQN